MRRRIVRSVAAGTIAVVAAAAFSPHVQAASPTLALVFTQTYDGTPVFDATPGPGNDTGPNNGIVRTHDAVGFNAEYSVNSGSVTNLTITADLTGAATFDPPAAGICPGGVAITTNGTHLVCNRGSKSSGTSESVPFSATVSGGGTDGSPLTFRAAISADQAPPVSGGAPLLDTVSARPQVNLRKTFLTTRRGTDATGKIPGYIVEYSLATLINTPRHDTKGSTSLMSPFSFTDILSYTTPGAPPVHAQLLTWDPTGKPVPACAQSADYYDPYGSLSIDPTSPQKSVTNSGTINCTQPGAGTPVAVTVSGADTTGDHLPTQTGIGTPIPATDFYLTSDSIGFFVPSSDIQAAGGSLTFDNTVSNFTATSTTGVPNDPIAETPTDNRVSFGITDVTNTGGFEKQYRKNCCAYFPGHSYKDGSQVATFGETYVSEVAAVNTGTVNWQNLVICDALDNTKNVVAGAASAYIVVGPPGSSTPVIEYTNAPNVPNQRDVTCGVAGDKNTDGPWNADPTAFPGGLSAITRVRAVYTTLVAGDFAILEIPLQALTVPNGTYVGNFGMVHTPSFPNPYTADGWYRSAQPYTAPSPGSSPGNFAFDPYLADRLEIVSAEARVTKTTVPNDSVNAVLAGTPVTFNLDPTLTNASGVPSTSITLTDTLPSTLSYVGGSTTTVPVNGSTTPASYGEPAITNNPDGTTTLVWAVNNVTPNTPLSDLQYQALPQFDAPNGTPATNTVVASSPLDLSPVNQRTSTRTITIVRGSSFNVVKTTSTPLIEVGDSMQFALLYHNTSGTTDVTSTDMIDVLPYNGDGRTPATSYTGARPLSGPPTGSNGETFLYSSHPSALIKEDPADPSNQPVDQTTGWCTQAQFGTVGCPQDFSGVTAFRVLGGPLPHNSATRTINVTLNTNGNHKGDLYTNHFTARAAGGPSLPVTSEDVVVRVVVSSLSGSVYNDLNNNGVRDAGEPGIPGVTITLSGTDDHGTAVNLTTTTDANGNYTFANLRDGNYTVVETQPAGYAQGTNQVGTAGGVEGPHDTVSGIALPTGTDASNYLFGERLGISGTVFVEPPPGTGVIAPGDQGLPGVTVTLTGTDNAGNPVNRTTLTAADGTYSFTGLAQANSAGYTLTETRPAGYASTSPTVLNNVPANAANQNFGNTTGSISGAVYNDLNDNGSRDAGEPGIAGATVTLTGTDAAGNPVNLTTTTAADGTYSFTGLLQAGPSGYTLTEPSPLPYNDGQNTAGTGPAGGNPATTDQISAIAQPAGAVSTGYLFGEVGTTISGTVFSEPPPGTGVIAPGDHGIPGVTVTLRNSGGTIVATTTTDSLGNYNFPNLPAGNYTITESPPGGYTSTSPTVLTVTVPLTGLPNQNFGNTKTTSGVVPPSPSANPTPTTSSPATPAPPPDTGAALLRSLSLALGLIGAGGLAVELGRRRRRDRPV